MTHLCCPSCWIRFEPGANLVACPQCGMPPERMPDSESLVGFKLFDRSAAIPPPEADAVSLPASEAVAVSLPAPGLQRPRGG